MNPIPFRDEVRRKLVHLSSFWMPLSMMLLSACRWQLALFFGVLTVLSILVEHAYARGCPTVIRIYDFFFGRMLRQEPKPSDWVISGGPPVFAASCLSLLFFPPDLAAASMAVMLAGDTAAALIGKRFGRCRFANGKSLEGSLAFAAAGTLAFSAFYGWHHPAMPMLLLTAFLASATGAAAEFFQNKIRLDDNLLIPLCAGFTVKLLELC